MNESQPVQPRLLWIGEYEKFHADHSSDQKQLGLSWVSESGITRPKGPSRNVIRSYARRNSHRGTALSQSVISESGAISSSIPRTRHRKIPHMAERTTQSKQAAADLRPRLLFPDPEPLVLEAFNCLPTTISRHGQELLNHWNGVMKKSYAPVSPQNKWLPLAISETVFLNTVLFISAMDLCGLRGLPLNPDFFFYKGETIKNINSNITSAEKHTSDATICAVAFLAQVEVGVGVNLIATSLMAIKNLTGPLSTAKMHMNALQVMIDKRGGLKAPDLHVVTRRQAAWTDSCAAMMFEIPFRFRDIGAGVVSDPAEWASPTFLMERYRKSLVQTSPLTDEILYLQLSLRNFSMCKDASTLDQSSYSDTLEELERRLVLLVQSPANSSCSFGNMHKIFGYAMLLHSYLFHRDLCHNIQAFYVISSRLNSLVGPQVARYKECCPEPILWVLIMGGIGSLRDAGMTWYASQVAEVCSSLGISSSEGITDRLQDWLWSHLYTTPFTLPFWNAVGRLQGGEGKYTVKRVEGRIGSQVFNTIPSEDTPKMGLLKSTRSTFAMVSIKHRASLANEMDI